MALGIGAGLVVATRHFTDPDRTARADLGLGAAASALVAAVSGTIGWLAAGGINHADRVGLGTLARWFVDWATDWRFWGAIVVVYYLVRWVQRRRRRPQAAVVEPAREPRPID